MSIDLVAGNTTTTAALNIGTSAISTIDTAGDADWWKVTLTYGYQYQVWVEGASSSEGTLIDPYLAFYNSTGVFQIASDDYSIYTHDSYLTVVPSATGTYYLSAEEYGNNAIGTYKITIWEDELASTATAARVAINSVSDIGRIGWQGDVSDWYGVSLTAGIQYQFDLIGSASDGTQAGLTLADPWLALRANNGTLLLVDNDSGLGLNSRIFFKPATSGIYYLDAQEVGSNAYGTYRLVVNATPTVGAMALGTSQTNSIGFAGDVDQYSVVLAAGVSYAFAVDGTTLADPYLEVLDSTGAVVSFDDDGGSGLNAYVTYTPATSGTYFLAARESGNNATGTYSARVWQLPTVSIANASVLEGNSGTTSLVFTLTLSAVSPIDVVVTAATSGAATATYSSDYTPVSGTVVIAAGQTSANFTVQVLGDTVFEPTEALHVLLSNPSGAVLGDSDAYGYIFDNDAPYNLPTDNFTTLEWYLYPTTGINAFPVWADYTGAGIRVAVFDQGIDSTHPDLDGNLLTSLGRKASNLTAGGTPVLSTDNHGTLVAGTIAAERNGIGVVGVSYGADLVSIYNGMTAAEIPNAFTYAANFDVLNNSWGFAPQGTSYYALYGNWAFADNFLNPAYSAAGSSLKTLASTGRHGLGTIVVQSAGNSFSVGDDTNLHNFQNSQYIVTVAATDYAGNVTSYSSPGASVLVAAPGGGGTDLLSNIITTDRVGAAGTDSSDYASTSGTSFSAPIVSGIVALMLEANPSLGYRDVQEILAYSAREVGVTSNDWLYNGASNWNGGGLHYDALSHNLGFGLVDSLAAVRLAETWTSTAHTATNREQVVTTHTVAKTIPDGGVTGAFDAISITKAIDVERVEVTLNVTHPFIGDLSVLLISPSGTTSFLLWRPQQNPLSAYGTNQDNIHFTFDTVLDWGESSVGSWGLDIFDNAYGDVGTFDSWTLNLIGKPVSTDDTYIYTNEFSESCANQSERSTLTDAGGTDTLNAAACSANLVLNLVAGGVSTIDGASLTIAAGTVIENAYGGDGNDAITGNGAANVLYGMRGDDHLDGGAGVDSLVGGPGNDSYVVDNIGDIVTENLNQGTDLVRSSVSYTLAPNVENLTLTAASTINAVGNGLDNILTGNAAANSLDGGSGNDVMYGGAGDDTFDWDANQRAGDDSMYGGGGNDTYVISGNDHIIEYAGEGVDVIWSDHSYSLVALTYVENLNLFGSLDGNLTGNLGANKLVGNGASNILEGLAGNDTLVGGDGIDTAVFSGTWAEYTLIATPIGWTLVGPDGSDNLATIEFAKFTDQTVSLGNFLPTGSVTIRGGAVQGQTLTASNTLADMDGLGSITYQWSADDVAISAATNSTYVLTQAEVGKVITVLATYTDGHGTVESVASSASAPVVNINDNPTGSASISGTATQGQTLTASNTLADADGIPNSGANAIHYQWKANSNEISGATNSTYALSQAEVGKVITVTASYTDNQGTAESVTSSGTAIVANINDAPTALGASISTDEDTGISGTLPSATDMDGDSISYAKVSGPSHGTVTIYATTGAYTYTPAANYNGTDSFTFKVNDGTVDSSAATISITVNAVNDAPQATAFTTTTDEDTAKTGTLAGTDVDGNTLTFAKVTDPSHGTVTINATTGAYTYTPAANYNGTDSFTFKVNDGTVDSSAATVSITVNAVNDAPTASAVSLITTEDKAKAGTLTGTDVEGSILTFAKVTDPSHGTVTINTTTGAYTYTPTVNYNGADSFTFKVNDGVSNSAPAQVSISVSSVNDTPTGKVLISGVAEVGHTLSALNTLDDPDGRGSISYQWFADGVVLPNQTAATLDITAALLNQSIAVKANYVDGSGYREIVSSTPTLPVSAPSKGAGVHVAVKLSQQTVDATHSTSTSNNSPFLLSSIVDSMVRVWAGTEIYYQSSTSWENTGTQVISHFSDGSTKTRNYVKQVPGATSGYADVSQYVFNKPLPSTSGIYQAIQLTADGDLRYQYNETTGSMGAVDGTLDSLQLKIFDDTDTYGGNSVTSLTGALGFVLTNPGSLNGTIETISVSTSEVTQTIEGVFTVSGNLSNIAYGLDKSNVSGQLTALTQIYPDGSYFIAKGETDAAPISVGAKEDFSSIFLRQDILPGDDTFNIDVPSKLYELMEFWTGAGNDTVTLKGGGNQLYLDAGSGNDVVTAYDGDQIVLGGSGQDSLDGGSGADSLSGGDGDDRITGGSGDDSLDGGTGTDTAVFSQNFGQYTFQAIASGWTISGPDGIDTVLNFELGQFADQNISLVNFLPTGQVTFNGSAAQGNTLSVNVDISDLDGLPANNTNAFSYQWMADGVLIQNATSSVFTLTQSQVGKAMTVTVSYTDGHGNSERVLSVASASVNNVNDLPTGFVNISGEAAQGATLSVSENLVDPDGLGLLSYQWFSNGVQITGATNSTLLLSQAEVGKSVSVAASYQDGFGALESVVSAATALVLNINDVPVPPAVPAVWASGVTNQAYTLTSESMLWGFTDADSDTLSVSNLTVSTGSLSTPIDGAYTYTPPENFSGTVAFSYNVVDGFGGVVPTQRSLTVVQKGIAQDGYVAKALVWIDSNADGLWTHESFTDKNNNQQVEAGEYVDANNNGVFDAESWDITDASGNFEGLSGSGNLKIEAWLYNANGVVPTIDLSTGKTFSGSLTAPGGSSVINPLTTLVQSAMASGKTEAQAQSLVRTALGVSEGVDLLSFDPVAQAQSSGQASEALKVQKAALQVANLMQVAVDTTAAAGATNLGSIVSSVATALVSAASTAASNTSSPTINLSNASLMASAISAAADTAFASSTDSTAKEVLKAQAQSIGTALSQVNNTIDTIVSSAIQAAGSGQTVDAASAMVNIVAAQIVAQEQVSAQAQNSVVQAVLTGDTTSTASISVNVAQSLELAKSKVAQVFVTQLGAAPLAVNNQVRLQLPGSLSAQRNALTTSDNVLTNDTADTAYTKALSAGGVGAATSLTALANGTLTLSGSYGSLLLKSDGSFLYTEDKTKTASILANQSAQDVFTYELSDSTGTDTRKDTATLTIGLDRLNFAPSVQVGQLKLKEQGASVTGDGETLLNLLGLASDADGDSLSLSGIKVGTQALGNAASLTTSYGTLTLKQGSYYYTPDQSNAALQALGVGQSLKETVSFSVSDGVNSAVSGALQITLQGANDAPTLQQALADYRVTENRTLSVTVPATSFADVDDATLTYSAKLTNGSALPSWMQFNATTRTFSISPGVDVVDATALTFAVMVTATESGGLTVSDSFDVMVRPLGSGYDIQANVAFWKADTSSQLPKLAGVKLTQGSESGTSTAQAGINLYSVEDTEGADDGFMTLSPQASSPGNAKSAITLTDVLAALKVYLGKPLPDSYTSPLNYIAADFDANGTVNLTDVLTLLKYYLGKSTTSAPSWAFVDAADFSSDGKSLAGATNSSISKTDATPHAIDQSFDNGHESIQIIGVLRGDVDGSWTV